MKNKKNHPTHLIFVSAMTVLTAESSACSSASSKEEPLSDSAGESANPFTSESDDEQPSTSAEESSERPEETASDNSSPSTDEPPESEGSQESSDESDEDTEGNDEPKFDVGQPDARQEEQGCKKVDFLFIVDNSISMRGVQDSLVHSFPLFIDSIKSTLPVDGSYQIMVVDTDDFGICSEKNCADPPSDKWTERCLDEESNGYACEAEYTECDQVIGAGVVHPTGLGASNQFCDFPEGQRFLLGDDPNLHENFECAGRVGTAGNAHEKPMDSLVRAMSDEMNGEGGCNEGFLRDDAILVVAFFTNDGGYRDSGTPAEWYETVITAKNGDEDASVVIGVTPTEDCAEGKDGMAGVHWREFVALFGDRGLQGRVCDEDYSPLFSEAVNKVKEACDDFIPPG